MHRMDIGPTVAAIERPIRRPRTKKLGSISSSCKRIACIDTQKIARPLRGLATCCVCFLLTQVAKDMQNKPNLLSAWLACWFRVSAPGKRVMNPMSKDGDSLARRLSIAYIIFQGQYKLCYDNH